MFKSKERYCVTCGTTGKPKLITKGSLLVEIFLWLCLLLPGLLYSAWRHGGRYAGCKSCGGKELIPVDSPRAKALRAGAGG